MISLLVYFQKISEANNWRLFLVGFFSKNKHFTFFALVDNELSLMKVLFCWAFYRNLQHVLIYFIERLYIFSLKLRIVEQICMSEKNVFFFSYLLSCHYSFFLIITILAWILVFIQTNSVVYGCAKSDTKYGTKGWLKHKWVPWKSV